MKAYPPPSFVFLALLGAEVAGGGTLSRARNSQTLSSARVKGNCSLSENMFFLVLNVILA